MSKVHPVIQHELKHLLVKYEKLGVDMFLFGSVADTWPECRRGADFDIAVDAVPATKDRRDVVRQLERDVARLPTIRPVDVVDLANVSPAFRETARKQARRRL